MRIRTPETVKRQRSFGRYIGMFDIYSVLGTKEPNEWVGGIERTCRAPKNI